MMPVDLGGDDSPVEKSYKALRSALGDGGTSEDEDSIDALRLISMSIGLAASAAFDERAALQAFPSLAQDALPAYEDILGIVPSVDETDVQRRADASSRWVDVQSSEIPILTATLRALDARFSVLDTPWSTSRVTLMGRAFAPYVPGADPFSRGVSGERTWSDYPNFSDRDIVVAVLDIGAGIPPGSKELSLIRRGEEILADALPAWAEGSVITEVGFFTTSSLTGCAGVTDS